MIYRTIWLFICASCPGDNRSTCDTRHSWCVAFSLEKDGTSPSGIPQKFRTNHTCSFLKHAMRCSDQILIFLVLGLSFSLSKWTWFKNSKWSKNSFAEKNNDNFNVKRNGHNYWRRIPPRNLSSPKEDGDGMSVRVTNMEYGTPMLWKRWKVASSRLKLLFVPVARVRCRTFFSEKFKIRKVKYIRTCKS